VQGFEVQGLGARKSGDAYVLVITPATFVTPAFPPTPFPVFPSPPPTHTPLREGPGSKAAAMLKCSYALDLGNARCVGFGV
jgi:hypothetical protein